MSRSVGQQMSRTMGLFQGLVALPAMFVLGEMAMWSLFEPRIPIYDFIASTFNAFFTAGILFVCLVQRNVEMSRSITVYFEEAKSGFATATWLWLLLDTIVDPQHYWYYNPPNHQQRGNRIIRALFSVIILLVVYYPTLIFAIVDKNMHEERETDTERADQEISGETEPLLRP